jgi:hypothetical protein
MWLAAKLVDFWVGARRRVGNTGRAPIAERMSSAAPAARVEAFGTDEIREIPSDEPGMPGASNA